MAHDPGVPVGPALRRFRKERGLTIEQTASRAKLHAVYYGDVERGKENPTVKVIDRVLTVLRRSWGEFGAAVDELRSEPLQDPD
ncbi:helix-turn-helix transcriptional regulator [Longimicrobium sp.]|uniref:helix-turn-helix domain-containing protein n=1 Tax=Longimicrobium sp. TaxID=2029185 RepID=UPI002BB56A54|nr:helix-turn-helix transcriptional regulator [Longimicrobium sp.]HSU13506.1 helix-turn-helix transcriptional regulator [Longimicrobium sp.]